MYGSPLIHFHLSNTRTTLRIKRHVSSEKTRIKRQFGGVKDYSESGKSFFSDRCFRSCGMKGIDSEFTVHLVVLIDCESGCDRVNAIGDGDECAWLRLDRIDVMISSGHAMLKSPLNFTASSPSSFSFSTEFVFVIFPLAKPPAYGQGMAFVVASKTDLMAKAATSGLGLFNPGNTNITENRILAVKHDTNESSEQFDESDNHVGIDINSIVSVASANATYFDATEGNNKTLLLAS
ncbi:hypothetical protein YC2023_014889 [Brassica napus]